MGRGNLISNGWSQDFELTQIVYGWIFYQPCTGVSLLVGDSPEAMILMRQDLPFGGLDGQIDWAILKRMLGQIVTPQDTCSLTPIFKIERFRTVFNGRTRFGLFSTGNSKQGSILFTYAIDFKASVKGIESLMLLDPAMVPLKKWVQIR